MAEPISGRPSPSDPARARDVQTYIDATKDARLVPLQATDLLVVEIRDAMIDGRWGPDLRDALCIREGKSKDSIEHAATQAGRFLRIQRAPELLLQTALAELRAIAEAQRDQAPAVAVAAWRTILEQIGKLVDRAEKADAGAGLETVFQDPPPELRRLLLGWLSRVAGGEDAEVVGVMEGAGWHRG